MTALNLAGRQLSQGPIATRIIDGETWSAEIDLTPVARAILADIARAMRGNAHWFTVLANTARGDVEFERVLDRILGTPGVREAFALPVTPDEAHRLSDELYEAWGHGDDPARCEHCHESFAALGSTLCAGCEDGLAARPGLASVVGGQR